MQKQEIQNKTAVVIYNLGGPNNKDDIESFLFNLFYDKNIIRLPNPLRFFIAKLITKLRKKEAIKNYEYLGGKSPLLRNTIRQRDALANKLNKEKYKVFVSMNFCCPMPSDTIQEIEKFQPANIILIPLYPQFSTTTTWSFLEKWKESYRKSSLLCKQKIVCCYFSQKEFVLAYANILKKVYTTYQQKNIIPYIVFVAHGLPNKIIKSGDPYQWQVQKTVKLILESTNITDIDYILAYQSRVGPVSWIKPYADEVIIKMAKQKKDIIVVPVSFVSEHVETLVELDIEYKNLAYKYGARTYYRTETVSVDNTFIEGLKNIVINQGSQTRSCPQQFCCYFNM